MLATIVSSLVLNLESAAKKRINHIGVFKSNLSFSFDVSLIEEKSAYLKNLKRTDLQEDKPLRADVNDRSIVLANIKGKLYAMDSVCSHEGEPLEEGTLTCP